MMINPNGWTTYQLLDLSLSIQNVKRLRISISESQVINIGRNWLMNNFGSLIESLDSLAGNNFKKMKQLPSTSKETDFQLINYVLVSQDAILADSLHRLKNQKELFEKGLMLRPLTKKFLQRYEGNDEKAAIAILENTAKYVTTIFL